MVTAIDEGDYFRLPPDFRDLNYSQFYEEGDQRIERVEEYHSHNTERLDCAGMKELLLKLDTIRSLLNGEEVVFDE